MKIFRVCACAIVLASATLILVGCASDELPTAADDQRTGVAPADEPERPALDPGAEF